MSELKDLQKEIVQFRDARDWKQFHNPKDLSISLMLEAAEVLEHFQWKNSDEMLRHIQSNKEAVGEELADVLYWVLLLANDIGINIEQIFKQKMEKNNQKYAIDKFKGNHKKYNEL